MSVRQRNNYHPLHFHYVRGENITLSKNGTVACRSQGFCNGIVFSDRPISVGERIYIKLVDISPNWSGALRIGFTVNDPVSLRSRLPRYACPDLTSMPGNWAKAIREKYAKKDSVLYYYVDCNGDVHYGIGSEEHGIIFGGVNVSCKLWAVLDIYGNTIAIEILDPRSLNQEHPDDTNSNSVTLQTKKRKNITQNIQPLSFHSIHGKNVTLKKNKSIISKKESTHSLAYAFTECPIEINKPIIMGVQKVDNYCKRVLVYGLTSCDPKTIDPHQLPEYADDLLDRPEYWIVKKKSYPFNIGDTIMFKINNQGEVEVTTNDDSDPIFYVDHTQPLWVFVNLTHSISELSLSGIFSDNDDQSETDDIKKENPGPSRQQSSGLCVICSEEADAVIYRCGHMCVCYNCASKLWSSGAHCPMCRNSIQDIIKVFKST